MDRLFRVNSPAVVAEIIDGEAVIMNLKSGNYFSTESVGSLVWRLIEDGLTHSQIVSSLNTSFSIGSEQVESALAPFLSDLLAHELVREEAAEERAVSAALPPGISENPPAFSAPILNVYADMKDILLIDPIHDVAEIGWPIAKPTGDA
jgi:Coenzyme PQQ synthesis protein D (PqqD)